MGFSMISMAFSTIEPGIGRDQNSGLGVRDGNRETLDRQSYQQRPSLQNHPTICMLSSAGQLWKKF